MAATDQNYRVQKTLDIVFALSGVLMLLSLVGMFGQDYFRDFKVEQRNFRDVEAGLAEQALLRQLPHKILADVRSAGDDAARHDAYEDFKKYLARFSDADKAVTDARAEVQKKKQEVAANVHRAQVELAEADARYRSLKADYDSKESLYNIAVDERDKASDADRPRLEKNVQERKARLDQLRQERDAANQAVEDKKQALHEAELPQTLAEKDLTDAEARLKKLRDELDRTEKLVQQKRWKFSDWLLSQPVIDAFNSPYRIQQYTLDTLPIDYNFKYVTRYDRCTTCHLGMERANYEKSALHGLVKSPEDLVADLKTFRDLMQSPPDDLKQPVADFRAAIKERRQRGDAPPGFDLDDLPAQVGTLPPSELTDARITEFCAHPRLDLFVDGNSPHPAQKFGCTSCHSGQGSSTDFLHAAHAPDNPHQKEQWENEHGWTSSHFWDYPMLPKRFVEATCLKCHHQVTDLVRYGNQVEAPKLLRGYNLLRENGCFACHEIAGTKGAREIGPDMRLEPGIPLDKMDPAERARLEADTANPPGTLRKIGPSLFRLAEKTNEDWVRGWIWSPRGFRPTTRMPHFYGLSNNDKDALQNTPQYGVDQKDFPSAEVEAVAFYLIHESQNYLKGDDVYRRTNRALQQYLEARPDRSDSENKELNELKQREDPANAPLLELRLQPGAKPPNIAEQITDVDGRPVQVPEEPKDDDGRKKERQRGRQLFSEKGCLACHFHEGTTKNGSAETPNVTSEADFGPDLSHVSAKLGVKPGDEASARRWLLQWILNPQVHHPRTRMPYTHLSPEEAAAVAAWLLSEGKDWKGVDPETQQPTPPEKSLETYKDMARLYLAKARQKQEIEDLLDPQDEQAGARAEDWLSRVRPDADEAVLRGGLTEEKLKLYVGRKAINRYGCFACHNVPGFETAKPIGTQLNDWGKKDPDRLAFEDIGAYVAEHHTVVPQRDDPKDATKPAKEWSEAVKAGKQPYEEFFFDLLEHHQREGFLHQKLLEPRSYDYHRQRAWDDRLRMPRFQFAHVRQGGDESDEDYAARQSKEEADAREAVMTFVLGLVAEPVPAGYVYYPDPDRLAEVKGRQLLERYNCVGCHQVRPGVYEFKPTPEALDRLEDSYVAAKEARDTDFVADDKGHFFTAHNAWTGPAPPWPDRLVAHGTDLHTEELYEGMPPTRVIRLTEALRFVKDTEQRELTANSIARLPDDLLRQSPQFGGAFANLMIGYLTTAYHQKYGDADKARAALPPQLIREGERTRPAWLFQFLRNPGEVRPQSYLVLRMPKFNLSDEEFRTLVDYFNATDKTGNPGIGLAYPYVGAAEHDEEYWAKVTAAYRERLGKQKLEDRAKQLQPLWEEALKSQLAEAERKQAALEAAVNAAPDADAKKKAEQDRAAGQKEVAALKEKVQKKDTADLRKDWEQQGVYAVDAYRLLTATDPKIKLCLACHQVGDMPSPSAVGPNLALAYERLRPEWTRRWIAYPDRLLYPSIMPQNFPHGKENFREIFEGPPLEQVTALRDVLMDFPKVAGRPENRTSQSALRGTE